MFFNLDAKNTLDQFHFNWVLFEPWKRSFCFFSRIWKLRQVLTTVPSCRIWSYKITVDWIPNYFPKENFCILILYPYAFFGYSFTFLSILWVPQVPYFCWMAGTEGCTGQLDVVVCFKYQSVFSCSLSIWIRKILCDFEMKV